MTIIHKSLYSNMDKEILYDEYNRFKSIVRELDDITPFYVYALCDSTGNPFYIGKGSGKRAWNHFNDFVNGVTKNKSLFAAIKSFNDPPIIFIVESNLREEEALNDSGNRGGVCSEEWCKSNPDRLFAIQSSGGKIGGKIVGSMPW